MRLDMKDNRGFSLVELLVYVSILGIASGLMVGILSTLVRVQNQETSLLEVSEQSQFLLQSIQRNIRDSSAIVVKTATTTTPLDQDAVPAEGSVLRLKMRSGGATSTVTIYLQGTAVKITERNDNTLAESTSAITSDRVLVSSLSFKKRSNPPGHDAVLVDFTIAFNTTNPQLSVSRTLQSAISRVSAAVFDSAILPSDDTGTYAIGSASARWGSGYFKSNLIVNGKIGVATTTTPTYEVDISGGVRATAASTFSTSTFTGFVAIGTSTAPTSYALDVSGALRAATSTFTGFVGIGSGVSTATSTIYVRRDANDSLTSLFIVNGSTGSSARPQIAVGEDELFKGFAMSYRGANAANTDLASASSTGVLHAFSSANQGINIIASSASASSSIRFATGGQATSSERMRITSTGNVGIGTTAPGSLFTVNGTIQWGGAVAPYIYSGIDSGGTFIEHVGTSATNDNVRIQASLNGAQSAYTGFGIDPAQGFTFSGSGGGNDIVLVGATTGAGSNSAMDVVFTGAGNQYGIDFLPGTNTASFAVFYSAALAGIGSITSNAGGTATAYNTTSDIRLKENISRTAMGLATLLKIPVNDFNFIADPSQRVQGFIAQDLYNYYPEAVTVGREGEGPNKTWWGVDYGRITPLLVAGIQDLAKENDALKARNQELERRIKRLEEKLGL